MLVDMNGRAKIALIGGTAVLALAGIGGGVAFASSPGTTPTPTASAPSAPTAPARHAKHRALPRRVEHGEFTVRTKHGTVVVDVQRGTVSAVSATSVTVRSRDGFTAHYTVGATSKVREHQRSSAISAVHAGDRVRVVAVGHTVRRLADSGT